MGWNRESGRSTILYSFPPFLSLPTFACLQGRYGTVRYRSPRVGMIHYHTVQYARVPPPKKLSTIEAENEADPPPDHNSLEPWGCDDNTFLLFFLPFPLCLAIEQLNRGFMRESIISYHTISQVVMFSGMISDEKGCHHTALCKGESQASQRSKIHHLNPLSEISTEIYCPNHARLSMVVG